jgi:hypothetical protein
LPGRAGTLVVLDQRPQQRQEKLLGPTVQQTHSPHLPQR